MQVKYKGILLDLEYHLGNKINLTGDMGRVVDEQKAGMLMTYVVNTYLTGVLTHSKVEKLLTKLLKKRMKQAIKFVYKELQSGAYDATKEEKKDGDGEARPEPDKGTDEAQSGQM